MGDRTTTYHPCPQCHKQMETYDAPSSLLYLSQCDKCGYKDEREYFEIDEHKIALMTPRELKELKKKDPEVKKFREEVEVLEKRSNKSNAASVRERE